MKVVALAGRPRSRLSEVTQVKRTSRDEATSAPRRERAKGGLDHGCRPSSYRRLSGLARRRREQLLYLVVGAWNTVFGYGVWALLEYLLHSHLHYLVIVVISWPFSVGNAYVCYRTFVFHSKGRVWRELPRFSLVYLVMLVSGLVALPILLHTLPFSIYAIQAGYTAVVVVVSYLGHKFFSFRTTIKRPPGHADTTAEGHAQRPDLVRKGA